MRNWRRHIAQTSNVPAFIVMHDTSLDELCQRKPRTLNELREVSGFGKRKIEVYGIEILNALKAYETHVGDSDVRATQNAPRDR